MEYERTNIHINNSEIPVKCKDTVDVHLTGGRYFFIAFAALMSMSALFEIGNALTEQNELKKTGIGNQSGKTGIATPSIYIGFITVF